MHPGTDDYGYINLIITEQILQVYPNVYVLLPFPLLYWVSVCFIYSIYTLTLL